MIGVAGQGLPIPTKGFPATGAQGLRAGVAVPIGGNAYALPAGGMLLVPPGRWAIESGQFSSIQVKDPVTTVWRTLRSVGTGLRHLLSDGTNMRIVNPLGTPVGALVTNVGSAYVQASTTVTAGTGASTWRAVIGGAISTTVTVGNDSGGHLGGTNWTYPPVVVFDPPPAGGVQATGYAAIASSAVSAITVVDQGAGYTAAPGVTLYPNPLDPTLGSITVPAVTTTLTGAGTVTAVLPVAPGTVLTSAPTLTIGGAGTLATATAIMALTVTAMAVAGGANGTAVYSAGGTVTTAAGAVVNPSVSTMLFVPRQFSGIETGATTGVIVDSGLFQIAPTASVSTATFTMGSTYDVIYMEPIPGF